MQIITYANAKSLVGEPICLQDAVADQVMLLVESVERHSPTENEWEAFTITFVGNESFRVPQGSYTVSHPGIGKHCLFISPNSPTEYEAVINRRRGEETKRCSV